MKILNIIPFLLLSTICLGQTLKEGSINFDYKDENRVYLSVKLPEKWVEQNEPTSQIPPLNGYFLFILPPKHKLVEKNLKVEIDTQTINWQEIKSDTIEYYIDYVYKESYLSPKIYNRKIDKNCASADVTYSIAFEFERIPPKLSSKKVVLLRKNLEEGKLMTTIKYEYYKVEEEPQIIVSTTFDTKLAQNLAYNKIIFLNGNYWSEFREILCTCPPTYLNISQIQRALRKNGYKIQVSGILDKSTKESIVDYQEKHRLPIGNLNIETLTKLEIEDNRVKRYEYIKTEN